jgi:hypothetical protein
MGGSGGDPVLPRITLIGPQRLVHVSAVPIIVSGGQYVFAESPCMQRPAFTQLSCRGISEDLNGVQ